MSRLATILTLLALGLATPAWSHHSHAMFDHASRITLTGTVTEFVYRNPHGFLYIDVKKDDGATVNYWVEMSNLTNMVLRGIGRTTFKAGGRVAATSRLRQRMGKFMNRTASAAAFLVVGVMLSSTAAQQTTIFTTTDFRKDRALWTDPAYYRNNTPGQLRGMALDIVPYSDSGQVADARKYGSEGTGKPGAVNLTSPHPYKTAWEHYQAKLKAAGGGTKHTRETIPDWSGRWEGGAAFGGQAPASDIVKLLTPEY